MNIQVVKPCAFCPGVKRVVDKTKQIIKQNKNANIYLIGNIVHNSELSLELTKNKNVHILENKSHNRLALVKSIRTSNNIVIFSAHGSDPKAIEYAKSKKWKVFDLTCTFVSKILLEIKNASLKGFHIAYYGDKNHVEAIAAKKTGKQNISIFKNKNDLKQISKYNKILVLSQTTMETNKFLEVKKWFKKIPNVTFLNTICSSSKQRQANAFTRKKYDIVFVVSDPKSHNGLSLFKILSKRQKCVVFVDPLNISLNKKMLKNKKNCAIFSSSSVSQQQINRLIAKLKG